MCTWLSGWLNNRCPLEIITDKYRGTFLFHDCNFWYNLENFSGILGVLNWIYMKINDTWHNRYFYILHFLQGWSSSLFFNFVICLVFTIQCLWWKKTADFPFNIALKVGAWHGKKIASRYLYTYVIFFLDWIFKENLIVIQ